MIPNKLNKVDTQEFICPNNLKHISIELRGALNLFDLYFSLSDIEREFNISSNKIEFMMVLVDDVLCKYISYPMLKRLLTNNRKKNDLVDSYLMWVNSILFANNNINKFFINHIEPRNSFMSTSSKYEDDLACDAIMDLPNEYDSTIDNLYSTVNQLNYQLEMKSKDIEILTRDIMIKEKEIEVLRLSMIQPLSIWI